MGFSLPNERGASIGRRRKPLAGTLWGTSCGDPEGTWGRLRNRTNLVVFAGRPWARRRRLLRGGGTRAASSATGEPGNCRFLGAPERGKRRPLSQRRRWVLTRAGQLWLGLNGGPARTCSAAWPLAAVVFGGGLLATHVDIPWPIVPSLIGRAQSP